MPSFCFSASAEAVSLSSAPRASMVRNSVSHSAAAGFLRAEAAKFASTGASFARAASASASCSASAGRISPPKPAGERVKGCCHWVADSCQV